MIIKNAQGDSIKDPLILVKIGTVDTMESAWGRVHLTIVHKNDIPKAAHHFNITISKTNAFWFHFRTKRAWARFFEQWKQLQKPWRMRLSHKTGRFYLVNKKGDIHQIKEMRKPI